VHTRSVPEHATLDPAPHEPAFVNMEDLLANSDVLCVNVPLNPSTRGLLGRHQLARMPRGGVLVVQSRGGIIDELAVAEMLSTGHLGGAAIDTFAEEPVPAGHPLRSAPGALLTAHNIGHTRDMFASFAGNAVEAVLRLLSGNPPRHVVNPDATAWWAGLAQRGLR
jgi:D-3-phosphoglycerate dehydrogenase